MNSLERHRESSIVVEIPLQFRPYVSAALLNAQVRYPSLRFIDDGDVVTVGGALDAKGDEVRRSVLHAIYREKIYADTLPMRLALVAAVTAR
jgi:hypothetical protein